MKVATTGIIEHRGKILIAKRKKKFNQWEFPGGRIDEGETPAECLVREIKEELSIDVSINLTMGILIGEYRDRLMTVHGFVLTYSGGKIKKNVHEEIKWINSSELNQYHFIEEDLLVWKRYQEIKKYKNAYASVGKLKSIK